MATIKNFKELNLWQLSRKLCQDIWVLKMETELGRDYSLWNQINSSSGSIMDNIAEGFERDGNREFIQFLSIAKSSCAELESQLFRAFDRNYFPKNKLDELLFQCSQIQTGTAGFIKYLKLSSMKGNKYKDQDS